MSEPRRLREQAESGIELARSRPAPLPAFDRYAREDSGRTGIGGLGGAFWSRLGKLEPTKLAISAAVVAGARPAGYYLWHHFPAARPAPPTEAKLADLSPRRPIQAVGQLQLRPVASEPNADQNPSRSRPNESTLGCLGPRFGDSERRELDADPAPADEVAILPRPISALPAPAIPTPSELWGAVARPSVDSLTEVAVQCHCSVGRVRFLAPRTEHALSVPTRRRERSFAPGFRVQLLESYQPPLLHERVGPPTEVGGYLRMKPGERAMRTRSSFDTARPAVPRGSRPITRLTPGLSAGSIGLVMLLAARAASPATITVDASNSPSGNPHFWSTCVGTGTASLSLRADLQTHYKLGARELGMQRVRGHGILNDDMGVYKGAGSYDWTKFDTYIKAIQAAGMQPIIELSFMPTALASSGNNKNPPKDQNTYKQFIQDIVAHCVSTYGSSVVQQWYWEVWNEPNYAGFWTGTQDDYFKMYDSAAAGATAALSNIQIGGPVTTPGSASYITAFLNHVKSSGARVTFAFVSRLPRRRGRRRSRQLRRR